ncbi:hypothetical protein KEM55_005811 [Ascosphaera atra]|nr:hypothetical protein KEM55_005811 [Ascosphaera atra]
MSSASEIFPWCIYCLSYLGRHPDNKACKFDFGEERPCGKCREDKKGCGYLPKELWTQVTDLLDLRERYSDITITETEQAAVANRMKKMARGLSKRATQITKEDAAKEEAEKKKGASKKADKEGGQKKGEKEPSKNKADTTTTTTTATKRAEPTHDALASTASAVIASTTSVAGPTAPAKSSAAPAQTGLRSVFEDYSFMGAGNNGDNDDEVTIISNEAPTTPKTTRKGFKSARGRMLVARTRRSSDESNISPSPLPMPPPLKQPQPKPAPPMQQQGA